MPVAEGEAEPIPLRPHAAIPTRKELEIPTGLIAGASWTVALARRSSTQTSICAL